MTTFLRNKGDQKYNAIGPYMDIIYLEQDQLLYPLCFEEAVWGCVGCKGSSGEFVFRYGGV